MAQFTDTVTLDIPWLFRNIPSLTILQQKCSSCERWSERFKGKNQYKYCPHCGAKIGDDPEEDDGK